MSRTADVLDEYFGGLIDLVTDHGGDVLRLAGDALIAIFTDEDEVCTIALIIYCYEGNNIPEALSLSRLALTLFNMPATGMDVCPCGIHH